MSGKPSDERLSAWLDDELSLEERAGFEKELNANPELQRELEDLRQISSLVKNAAAEGAPDGLHSAVMRAVERESLLATSSETAATSMRRQIAIVAGIAAAVVLAVVIFNRDNNDDIAEVDPQPGGLTRERPIGEQPANRPEESKPGEEAVQVSDSLSILKTDLTAARVGDIIEGIGPDGVSVIRLTVVDRDESSIEALQLILARESLPVDNSGKPVEGENGLVAVYVESSPEELTKALARLRDSFNFNSLDVSSLALSDLEKETRDDLKQSKSGQRVLLKPGTRLAQLAETPKGTTRQPTSPTGAGENPPPVRVIFVVVDQPEAEEAGEKESTSS